MLLGWAYFPDADDNCNQGSNTNYTLNNNRDTQSTTYDTSWTALDPNNPSPSGLDSLYFDVSCSAEVAYGTVPLGPASASSQNNSIGNPGPWHTMPLTLNILFASTTPAQ